MEKMKRTGQIFNKLNQAIKEFLILKGRINSAKNDYKQTQSKRKILQEILINLSTIKNRISIQLTQTQAFHENIMQQNSKMAQYLEEPKDAIILYKHKKQLLQRISQLPTNIQGRKRQMQIQKYKESQILDRIDLLNSQNKDLNQNSSKYQYKINILIAQSLSQQTLRIELNSSLKFRKEISNQLTKILAQMGKKIQIQHQIAEQTQVRLQKLKLKMDSLNQLKHQADQQGQKSAQIVHNQKKQNEALKMKLQILHDIKKDHENIHLNINKIFQDIKQHSIQEKIKKTNQRAYIKGIIKSKLQSEYINHLICKIK